MTDRHIQVYWKNIKNAIANKISHIAYVGPIIVLDNGPKLRQFFLIIANIGYQFFSKMEKIAQLFPEVIILNASYFQITRFLCQLIMCFINTEIGLD